MNTHILIPIEDIEKEINLLSSDPVFTEIKKDIAQNNGITPQQRNKRNYLLQRIEGLQWALDKGKSISLDEKGINTTAKKAEKYQEEVNGAVYPPYFYKGYKQALKELL